MCDNGRAKHPSLNADACQSATETKGYFLTADSQSQNAQEPSKRRSVEWRAAQAHKFVFESASTLQITAELHFDKGLENEIDRSACKGVERRKPKHNKNV